jgi:hypothetical protein
MRSLSTVYPPRAAKLHSTRTDVIRPARQKVNVATADEKLKQILCISDIPLPFFCVSLQDAYAEPGQDSRNIAGIDLVIIVEDVQDVAPVFTLAPPVTRLPSGLIPGDKVGSPWHA